MDHLPPQLQRHPDIIFLRKCEEAARLQTELQAETNIDRACLLAERFTALELETDAYAMDHVTQYRS
jgi:hypothetical protein